MKLTVFFSSRRYAPGLLGKVVSAEKTREAVVPNRADLPDLPADQAAAASNRNVEMPGEGRDAPRLVPARAITPPNGRHRVELRGSQASSRRQPSTPAAAALAFACR